MCIFFPVLVFTCILILYRFFFIEDTYQFISYLTKEMTLKKQEERQVQVCFPKVCVWLFYFISFFYSSTQLECWRPNVVYLCHLRSCYINLCSCVSWLSSVNTCPCFVASDKLLNLLDVNDTFIDLENGFACFPSHNCFFDELSC